MMNPKAGAVLVLILATSAFAHCDGLDGPVVQAARRALESGQVNHVLIWVQKQDEPVIRSAFQRTLAVRKLGPEARELADTHFFETLVRIHRAGEGAPYSGLKPAGRDLGPAIPAADKAVASGAVEPVLELLTEAARGGLHRRFHEVIARKSFKPADVTAGREYVRAYVEFIHYVEGVYGAAAGQTPSEPGHAPPHH